MKINCAFKTIIISVFSVVLVISCVQKKAKLIRDENNQLVFNKEKNYDKSIKNKLALTLENVQDTIQFIKKNYPDYDFWEYEIDDLSSESLVKDFNDNGPEYCVLYLDGIERFIGYSIVFSWLNGYLDVEPPQLFSYHFWIDEEFSDRSGIMFGNYISYTNNTAELRLWKRKYVNTDNYYWSVLWPIKDDDDEDDENAVYDDYEIFQLFTKDEKREILTTFLRQFRDTKTFENIDLEWFGNVYTGIEGNRQIIWDILWEIPYDEE
jgi:uncharacterized protein YsxB (DUF464 family)